MSLTQKISVIRVESELERQFAVQVLRATYCEEKNWADSTDQIFPWREYLETEISWFVACDGLRPLGVIRVLYDPPLDIYQKYKCQPLVGGFDVEAFLCRNQIAEIGRFAVMPGYRRYPVVAAALMRAASRETIDRGYSHYITDIFENEAHSPYDFHTRIMGFEAVATHDTGELNCPNRRVTMLLDLRQAYRRLRENGGWIFRFLTGDWDEATHRRLLAGEALAACD